LRFLSDVKAERGNVEAPVYSHLTYDVVEGEKLVVDRPDILIVEGVNVLLAPRPPPRRAGSALRLGFLRFLGLSSTLTKPCWNNGTSNDSTRLRLTSFRDPRAYFRIYADLDEAETTRVAKDIWERINLQNLRQNIAPTRRAPA